MASPADPQPVRLIAPAKINLYLHVVCRRNDGYHELDSLVMFADAGDRLRVEAARGATEPVLRLEGPFAPALAGEPPASNLVVRAAVALAAHLGRPPAVAITLTKLLPVASGIGGGSADAAACLRALARLWGAPADDPALLRLAAGLGADVPVCLDGRAAYFGGIGDILQRVPALPDCPALLVNAGVAVPTPAVFRARSGPFSPPARFAKVPATVQALAAELRQRRNDLTEPAIQVAPVIAEVLADLDNTAGCLLTRLSGSGGTCFALFADDEAVADSAARLSASHPEWWVQPCRLVSDIATLQS